ncbi:MAG: hypothetical protein IJ519_03590 [Clostridia bacterium]|nr:hypothetical protein [Clostridia bacterium]
MLALFRRFDRVYTERDGIAVRAPFGTVRFYGRRSLYCDMPGGGSCGIGDDVYAFACDGRGVWYMKRSDVKAGYDYVYWFDVNGILDEYKGVLDGGGSFVYIADGELCRLDTRGVREVLTDVDAVSGLITYRNGGRALTLSRVTNAVTCRTDRERYTGAYRAKVELYSMVDRLTRLDDIYSVSPRAVCKLMVKLLEVSHDAGIDLQRELVRYINRDYRMNL